MRTLRDKFELATESIVNEFGRFGYVVKAVVDCGIPFLMVSEIPTNFPTITISTECDEDAYYFNATVTFPNVRLEGNYADSIESELLRFAQVGKVITELHKLQFDPAEWEED